MSVSANYSSKLKTTAKSTKKCQKCAKSAPTSRTTGDFCTECFLNTSHKRFVATLGKAGVRKFERIVVPFDGDVNTLTLLDHLKHHHAFAMPFPYSIHNETTLSPSQLTTTTTYSTVATALDISTVPKVKKVKKVDPDQPEDSPISTEQPSEPTQAIPTVTNDPAQQFPFYRITNALNTDSSDMLPDLMYSPSFPLNIDPQSYLSAIPTIAETTENYQHALAKLCDANKICTQGQAPMLYRCFFINVEGTYINTLIASNGQTPFLSTFQSNATPQQRSIVHRLNGTGVNFNSVNAVDPSTKNAQIPHQYPIVRLVDITTSLPTDPQNPSQSQRVLPYVHVKNDDTNEAQLIGSQLLTNVTTLPVLSIPLEHIVPDHLISQQDVANATKSINQFANANPTVSISTSYYTILISKSFALYRVLTQDALPNPLQWQKQHQSYFSSVIDFLHLLKRRLLLHLSIYTHSRAILSTPTLEDLSSAMISGLTKGRADSFLPRLVQWTEPIQPSAAINACYVDTNAIENFSYAAKHTILHTAKDLPLTPQIPIINVFSETPTKALFLHALYTSRQTNLISPTQPYLYWFPSEYNLASPLLSTTTKNVDRVTSNFISLLASMNDSSAANIIKTTDKLIPHRSVQRLHARFTKTNEQMKFYGKNKLPRKACPAGIAQFIIEDDDDDDGDDEEQTSTINTETKELEQVADVAPKPAAEAKKASKQPVTQKERPAAPVLHYNNTSDGWYGDRCTLCGHISPKTHLAPQPPVRIVECSDSSTTQAVSTQHMQNHPGFCSPCTLLIKDCDPGNNWMELFARK